MVSGLGLQSSLQIHCLLPYIFLATRTGSKSNWSTRRSACAILCKPSCLKVQRRLCAEPKAWSSLTSRRSLWSPTHRMRSHPRWSGNPLWCRSILLTRIRFRDLCMDNLRSLHLLRSGAPSDDDIDPSASCSYAFNSFPPSPTAECLSEESVAHDSHQQNGRGFNVAFPSGASTNNRSYHSNSNITSSILYSLFYNTIKITSWNGRAIISATPKWRRPKLAVLWKLIHANAVVLLQELHGSATSLALLLDRIADTHFIIYGFTHDDNEDGGSSTTSSSSSSSSSAHSHSDSGGVLILICKAAFPSFFVHSSVCIVPGRVLEVALKHPSGFIFKLWNIHNYGISTDQYRRIRSSIQYDSLQSKAHPLMYFVIVGGDFNIHREDSIRFNMAMPSSPPIPPRAPPHS